MDDADADVLLHASESSFTGGGPAPPSALAQKRTRRERMLINAAAAPSRQIELVLISAGMQRRVENKSWWNKKEDKIMWRVAWHCRHRGGGGGGDDDVKEAQPRIMVSETADEAQSVAALAATAGVPGAPGKRNREDDDASAAAAQPVMPLVYFLRKERCPANDQRFYTLGAGTGTLQDALRGRVVVEHPVVVICAADAPDTHPKLASSTPPGEE